MNALSFRLPKFDSHKLGTVITSWTGEELIQLVPVVLDVHLGEHRGYFVGVLDNDCDWYGGEVSIVNVTTLQIATVNGSFITFSASEGGWIFRRTGETMQHKLNEESAKAIWQLYHHFRSQTVYKER